jgi:hypothetical protein
MTKNEICRSTRLVNRSALCAPGHAPHTRPGWVHGIAFAASSNAQKRSKQRRGRNVIHLAGTITNYAPSGTRENKYRQPVPDWLWSR